MSAVPGSQSDAADIGGGGGSGSGSRSHSSDRVSQPQQFTFASPLQHQRQQPTDPLATADEAHKPSYVASTSSLNMPPWWPQSSASHTRDGVRSSSDRIYWLVDDDDSTHVQPVSAQLATKPRRPHRKMDSQTTMAKVGALPVQGDPRFRPAEIIMPPGGGGIDIGDPVYRRPPGSNNTDDTLAIILPLLILLSTLLFLLLLFIILVIVVRRRARIALGDSDGPVDVGREEALQGQGFLDGVEQRWLELQDPPTRQGYARAKDWTLSYPPGSQSTDITLSQFLSIQEKGVSAWSFDPDYESNPSVFVEARTEITFLADGEGMAPSEGGGCCVQSNLPLPKVNEVYYWEAKMFNKPDSTNVALGLTTKPYPTFRLPGWSRYSIGYFSADGFKSHNYPFAAQSYGPAYRQGDVIGIGYRPRTGTVFFTRNGKRLEDAFIGLNRYNLFPTVGADGACEVHVNLGQAGFVYIEANVKKWGLAPMVGTLAPPPAYGQEGGSILIETGTAQGTSSGAAGGAGTGRGHGRGTRTAGDMTPPPPVSPYDERGPSASASTSAAAAAAAAVGRNRLVRGNGGGAPPRTTSLRDVSPSRQSEISIGSPPNPPTPHRLDISMHSLNSSSERLAAESSAGGGGGTTTSSSSSSYFPTVPTGSTSRQAQQVEETLRAAVESGRRSPSPPPYSAAHHAASSSGTGGSTSSSSLLSSGGGDVSAAWMEGGGQLGGTGSLGARRGSGRTHAIANAVLGMLGDRGLLTPLSARDISTAITTTPGSSSTSGSATEAEERAALTAGNTRRNASDGGAAAQGWWNWMTGR